MQPGASMLPHILRQFPISQLVAMLSSNFKARTRQRFEKPQSNIATLGCELKICRNGEKASGLCEWAVLILIVHGGLSTGKDYQILKGA